MKQRLLDMMPNVCVFLDVDHTATGSEASSNEQVDTSNTTLCFATMMFFDSGPCLQEVVRAVLRKKPIILVLEEDEGRGGLTEAQVRAYFEEDKWNAMLGQTKNRLGRSGGPGTLRDRVEGQWAESWGPEWAGMKAPTGEEMLAAFFASPPIIFFRLTDLQVSK